MAVEQDWAAYADQVILEDTDTILARTAVGAGVEVTGSGLRMRLPLIQRVSAYTLALTDRGTIQYMTAGAFALTVPADATVAFPIGTVIWVIVEDAAKTVVGASGVTVVLGGTGAGTAGGTRNVAIGTFAQLVKVQTNRWYLAGPGVS